MISATFSHNFLCVSDKETHMPEKETLKRARADKRKGRSASTQAGEFVREEMHHIREGKHGARSPEQAIAIGLSKARRSGVKLPPPEGPSDTREQAKKDIASAGHHRKTSAKRSRAVRSALKHEGRSASSGKALAAHSRRAARKRSAADRSRSAKKAARTRARSAS